MGSETHWTPQSLISIPKTVLVNFLDSVSIEAIEQYAKDVEKNGKDISFGLMDQTRKLA